MEQVSRFTLYSSVMWNVSQLFQFVLNDYNNNVAFFAMVINFITMNNCKALVIDKGFLDRKLHDAHHPQIRVDRQV